MLRLAKGGRLVVESYHSLEDRMVKRFMAPGLHVDLPAGMPVVPDQARPYLSDLTHGAIKADLAERERNPRSASVRLRAVEMIGDIPEERRRRLQAEARGQGSAGRHRRAGHGSESRRRS